MMRIGLYAFGLLALALVASLEATDFIRGDANGDGRVTISDCFRILMWYQDANGYNRPQCMDAADVDDNGVISDKDIVYLLQAQYLGGRSIPPPFPEPVQDLTDDLDPDVDCQAYGGGEVREHPTCKLKTLDPTAPGGDESTALLRIALTNSVPIAAVSGQIRLLSPIVQHAAGVDGPAPWTFHEAILTGEDRIWFGVMARFSRDAVPPGQDVQVVRDLFVCLKEGTPAGEYPVVLESAELTDAQTGEAIVPLLLAGGTLVVKEAVTGANSGPYTVCRRVPPDPRPTPETVNAAFALHSRSAARGESVAVPFTIRVDAPVDGYSFSMDFDEAVLRVQSAEFAWETPDGSE